jgi:hypothetical protein
MTDHLSQNIIQAIQERHITPKPRWTFAVKHVGVWTAGASAIVIGGLATSVMMTYLWDEDWRTIAQMEGGSRTILLAIPYFWIACLIGFLVLAHYALKHTKHGYRYAIPVLAIATVVLSGILGCLFTIAGLGKLIDTQLENRVPMYARFGHPRAFIWNQPERGMIGGRIIMIVDERTFLLQDPQSHVWRVRIVNPNQASPMPEDISSKVRCLGERIAEQEFAAIRIFSGKFQPPFPIFTPRERIFPSAPYEREEGTR